MTSRYGIAFPRLDTPELCKTTRPQQRAQGKPGARCTRSLACKVKEHTSVVTTGSDGFNRLSPRNGFNGLFRALVSARCARMCERAVVDQPPVAGSEPVLLEGRKSLTGSEGL